MPSYQELAKVQSIDGEEFQRRLDLADEYCKRLGDIPERGKWENRFRNLFVGLSPPNIESLMRRPTSWGMRFVEDLISNGGPAIAQSLDGLNVLAIEIGGE